MTFCLERRTADESAMRSPTAVEKNKGGVSVTAGLACTTNGGPHGRDIHEGCAWINPKI